MPSKIFPVDAKANNIFQVDKCFWKFDGYKWELQPRIPDEINPIIENNYRVQLNVADATNVGFLDRKALTDIVYTSQEFNGKHFKIGTWRDNSDRFSAALRRQWLAQPPLQISSMILRPGEFFLDLGANVGTFCIPLAIYRGSPFMAFEALTENYLLLTEAIQANNLDPFSAHNFAVWSNKDRLRFKGTSAYGQFDELGDFFVEAIAIDEYFLSRKIHIPALIKIDIEGAELKAFQGMRNLLCNQAVRAIVFEGNGAHCYRMGHTTNDLIEELENCGFICFVLYQKSLVRVRSGEFIPFAFADYIAVRNISTFEGLYEYSIRKEPLSDEEIIKTVSSSLKMSNNKYGLSVKASYSSRVEKVHSLLQSLLGA